MADPPPELLHRWTHSHEEDEGDVRVYRTDDFDFPLARGRRSLEFLPGGELRLSGPGPTDRPTAASGSWEALDGTHLCLRLPEPQEVEIASLAPDRLALRWPGG